MPGRNIPAGVSGVPTTSASTGAQQGTPGSLREVLTRGIRDLGFLDLRSLALFRVMLGGLIILDVLLRCIDLRAFYTDFGVLPRTVVIEKHDPIAHFSFLMSSGAAWFQGVMLLCAAAAGGALAIGYRTRLAAILSWVLLVSIQYRNPLILQGGDVLFRILVIFAAMLPVGAVWSFDARSRIAVQLRPSLLHFAYVAQIACVYIVTGAAKCKNPEWRSGFGLPAALWLQQYTTWFGDLVGALPLSALQVLNAGVLATEILLPLLLFVPWRVPFMRTACFVILVSFHIAIFMTLKTGLFGLISVIAWLPLLPTFFWDVLASKLRSPAARKLLQLPVPLAQAGPPLWLRRCQEGVGVLFLAFLLVWNGSNIRSSLRGSLRPEWLRQTAIFFGIDQSWQMFSRSLSSDGWFLVPAVRADGSVIDLFSGEEYRGPQRPESISASFPGDRWRKYWRNLLGKDHNYQRLGLGRYLCRLGAEERDPKRRIEALQIIFIQEQIKEDGSHGAPEKILLWNHECKSGNTKKWEKKLPFSALPFPKGSLGGPIKAAVRP